MIKEVMNYIAQADPEIGAAILREYDRQMHNIELIASENIVSGPAMMAMGTVLTNKYAEGYPGKRYYGGCVNVDEIETIAIERAKKLFGCEYANVQPHSGAQANMAVTMAICEPGDTIMGMSLDAGGHLTHGSPANFSGRFYNIVPYGINADGYIDYDEVEALAMKHHPKMIIAGASAYPRIIDFKRFREIADRCGAVLWVDMAHIAGLVAAGLHPSPIPYADVTTTTTHKTLRGPRGGLILSSAETAERFKFNKNVFPGSQGGPLEHVIAGKAVAFGEALKPEFATYIDNVCKNAKALGRGMQSKGLRLVTGGTDNHLLLVDLTPAKDITGRDAEQALERVGITVNKNTIPGERRSPFVTSGIRVGSAAITTRGFSEEECERVGQLIGKTVFALQNDEGFKIDDVKAEVAQMLARHPLYPELA